MAQISVTDAAFTGFRVIRRNPGVLISWALLHIIMMAAFAWVFFTRFGPLFEQMQSFHAGAATNPATAAAMIRQILPIYAYLVPIGLIMSVVIVGAANRAVLRPRESGLGYLRLGMDEIRLLVLMLAFLVLGIVFELVWGGISFAVGFGVKTLLAKSAPTVPHFLPILIGVGLFIIGVIIVEVRLCLAPAQTFATKKINLFGSWALTAGQFWPILGTFLLAFVLCIVVAIVVGVVVALLAMLAGGGMSLAMMHGGLHGAMSLHGDAMTSPAVKTLVQMRTLDWKAVAAVVTPFLVIQVIGGALQNALVWAVLLTPTASIYRALTADTSARVATPLNMG